MHDAVCVWQSLHQLARTACMIEMHVREKHEVDIADIQVLLFECVDEQRNAAVYTGVDESSTAILDDQMAGVLKSARVFRVDGDDAIIKLYCLRAQRLLRFGGFEPVESCIVFCEQGNIVITKRCHQRRHDRVRASAITILI